MTRLGLRVVVAGWMVCSAILAVDWQQHSQLATGVGMIRKGGEETNGSDRFETAFNTDIKVALPRDVHVSGALQTSSGSTVLTYTEGIVLDLALTKQVGHQLVVQVGALDVPLGLYSDGLTNNASRSRSGLLLNPFLYSVLAQSPVVPVGVTGMAATVSWNRLLLDVALFNGPEETAQATARTMGMALRAAIPILATGRVGGSFMYSGDPATSGSNQGALQVCRRVVMMDVAYDVYPWFWRGYSAHLWLRSQQSAHVYVHTLLFEAGYQFATGSLAMRVDSWQPGERTPDLPVLGIYGVYGSQRADTQTRVSMALQHYIAPFQRILLDVVQAYHEKQKPTQGLFLYSMITF